MYNNYGCLITTTVFEEEHVRASAVLGSDGKPLLLERKKQQIGFDLSTNRKTEDT